MNALFLQFLKDMQNKGRLKFYENHSLSLVSTFAIGGKARVFVTPYDTDTLCRTVFLASQHGLYKVIGNASNLLFDDYGFDGTVISTVKIKGVSLLSTPVSKFEEAIFSIIGASHVLYAECGAMLPLLSRYAMNNGITGFEGLCSIPATVGGALCLNAGAYGSEISDKLLAYHIYCPKSNAKRLIIADRASFSYRSSPINKSNTTVLSAYFKADSEDFNLISARVQKNKALRLANQPQGVRSAGSFFKRPSDCMGYPPFRGKSAGQIIDMCGLKGMSIGGAQVSKKHANFLINVDGSASANDVLELARRVKSTVYKKTGISLCEEVEFVPFRKHR